jgi:TRAP-type C4-dicarboxylate transport system permease small subunit
MAETDGMAARPATPAGRALYRIADLLAIFGGILSCAMATIVTISVAGRYAFSAPIPGDYDLVGILCGCAIFAFLPYCQLHRGNVLADFFTQKASPRVKAALDAMGNLFFCAAIVMFTWRLYYGTLEMKESAEQISAFAFYRWWTMPFDIVCMIVLIVAIFYSFLEDLTAVSAGHPAERPIAKGE